jgi:hypothetical protein
MKGGIRLMQGATTFNTVRIEKAVMNRMLNKERYIVTYGFSYSDWKGYYKKPESYRCAYEVRIVNKSPLELAVIPVPAK